MKEVWCRMWDNGWTRIVLLFNVCNIYKRIKMISNSNRLLIRLIALVSR